ncbi:MAG: CRTAC1 family protein [Fimbriimonadaceae bacterium]|nr:CRTAC1 family protein [Fimbriimonadaceae bacterium]
MEIIDKTHLLKSNPLDLSYGVTIQDFDGDGKSEIFVATQAGPNHLYKLVDGGFTDCTPQVLRDSDSSGIGVAAADLTGNGLPDIYILNTGTFMGPLTEPDRLFLNEGNLVFREMMEDHPDRNLGAGRSICWTDPLGTMRYGLYLCNYGAPNLLFVNGGGPGAFRNMAAKGAGLGMVMGGRSVISQDFFGKNSVDIFVLNEGGPNLFFRGMGGGQFEEVAEVLGLDDPLCLGSGLQAADLDRDGEVEFLWANWEGPNRLMKRDAAGRYVNVAPESWERPSKARTVIVADLDNDGWEEVFLNNMEEPNRLFRNVEGQLVEVDPGPLLLPDGAGTAASVGDLDGDGMLEIYVAHGESMPQRNRLFSCNPQGHHFVRVQPLTPSGAPAVASRVELLSERPQLRFIDGGSGYLCQMEPVAHFGLGLERTVPPVRITWSDGTCRVLDGLALDDLTQVTYPSG